MQTVTVAMMQESIWFDRLKFEQDLEHYQMFVHNNLPTLNAVAEAPAKEQTKQEPKKKEQKSEEPKSDEPKQQKTKKTEAKVETKQDSTETSTLTGEIEKARRAIEDTLSGLSHSVSGHSTGGKDGMDVSSRVDELESENRALRELLNKLTLRVEGLEARLGEAGGETCQSAPKIVAKEEPKKVKEEEEDDDDDFDMFGDDDEEEEETEEEQKIREEKLANYHAKKAGKKAVIAKSSLLIDVKPWDNETDMKQLEACVRTIEVDGLIWGGAKLIPVAYGVFKCQITAVIEDAKVDTEELQDQIKAFEEFVQSTDIAGFNKI